MQGRISSHPTGAVTCVDRESQSEIHHFFFFNDTATTEIYTLSLHDALPISPSCVSTTTRSNSSTAMATSPRCWQRSEEHTSELQSPCNLVCRLLLEKKTRAATSHARAAGAPASRPRETTTSHSPSPHETCRT